MSPLPRQLNLAAGAVGHFTCGFTHARLRRKGAMTTAQRGRMRGYTIRRECTPSREVRNRNNPRFPVNPVDLLLTGRRFVTRTELPASWGEYYRRRVDTPGITNPRRHALKLAM